MSELANSIVTLWFFPVTVFIVIPLVMLLSWGLIHLVKPRFTTNRVAEKNSAHAEDAHQTSKANV